MFALGTLNPTSNLAIKWTVRIIEAVLLFISWLKLVKACFCSKCKIRGKMECDLARKAPAEILCELLFIFKAEFGVTGYRDILLKLLSNREYPLVEEVCFIKIFSNWKNWKSEKNSKIQRSLSEKAIDSSRTILWLIMMPRFFQERLQMKFCLIGIEPYYDKKLTNLGGESRIAMTGPLTKFSQLLVIKSWIINGLCTTVIFFVKNNNDHKS